MADQLQLRGGTTTEHNTFTGASKEVTVDTTKKTAVVHDGATAGGNPLMREDGSNSALALGSQGTPSLKFTGDTNTGIYSPGADQVAISTNGTGRLFIDASGNVTVSGGGQITSKNVGASPGKGLIQLGESGAWQIEGLDSGYGGSGAYLKILSGVTERLRITSDGKLGLGTSAPSQLLEVHGTAAAGGIGINITNEGDGGAGTVPYAFINARLNPVRNAGEIRFGKEGTYGDAASSDSYMAFYTAVDDVNTERLRITSDGNVGIGTTTVGNILDCRFSGEDGINVQSTTSSNANITLKAATATATSWLIQAGASVSNGLRFYDLTAGSERARIDSSGRLLVGTSTSATTALLQVRGNSAAATNPGTLYLFPNYAPASLGTGDVLGRLQAGANDGSVGATIDFVADAFWGSGDYPTRLVFSTTSDGASSPTERMAIDKDGHLLFANAVTNGATGLGYSIINAGGYPYVVSNTNIASRVHYYFSYNSGTVGTISTTTTSTAYNTSSDYRLKENVVPLTGAADRLNQLQVRRFNFIADPDKTVDGFIAHEAQAVVPEAVTGTHNEVDDDGNPVYQGIDQSKLVPLLTAALQEALAKIETLEQRLSDAGIA